MRAKTICAIILCSVLLIVAPIALAEDLKVRKTVNQSSLKVGEAVQISLEITNPYDQDLLIQIADKNVFANNGLDIQCLERTVPKSSTAAMQYDPMVAYGEGEFTLEAAKITYADPESGEQKTAVSNQVNISVSGGTIQGSGSGVTTIYECGGTSMRSTSYSGGSSSMQVSIGSNGMSIQQQMNQANQDMQQQAQESRDMMNKALQNMQQSQDMNTLRQQLQAEQKEMQQNQEALREQIESDSDFQNMKDSLARQGFKQTSSDINPSSNESGEFEYKFQSENGQQATISGNVSNGSIQNMTQELQDPVSRLEEENQDKPNLLWRWLAMFLILALVLAYVISKYFQPKQVVREIRKHNGPVNHKLEAKKILARAKEEFDRGDKKEAYHTASFALRYYLTHRLGAKSELTASNAIILLKESGKDIGGAQNFFSLCNLVGFAKYKPNKPDFEKIMKLAHEFLNKL